MKTLLTSAMFRVLTTIGLFTLALPACSTDGEAFCDDKCDCEGCSNQTLDDCYFDASSKEREADGKGCLDFYDDLKACEYDTGFCKSGNDYETACHTEKERYDNCKK
jgi:hypothetical protein